MRSKRGKAKPAAKSAKPAKSDGKADEVVTVRITEDLAPLRLKERIRVLVSGSGMSEGQIVRSLLMLGLPLAEKDPAAVMQAAARAREGAAA